ncbi:MAG: hypothetical protein V4451_04725 [Pseudomonadota bacterium]
MPRFVSRATFVSAGAYSGATAQAQRGSLWDALKASIGLVDSARVPVTATAALTIDQCGTLEVSAAAGNVVLTLPASGLASDEAVYEITRTDVTANTLTLAAAGADTIDGAANITVLGTIKLRMPAGGTVWRVMSISGATQALARSALGISGFVTGMVMSHDDDTAPAGWIMSSGRTIGDAASGATERANADTYALFEVYWRTRSNAVAPIQDSAGVASVRGASAAADFAAHKRLPTPDRRGRVDVGKDDMGGTAANRITNAGSGVVGTTLGATGGAETHTLTTAQLANHPHGQNYGSNFGTSGGSPIGASGSLAGSSGYDTATAGSGSAHNNTQPSNVTNKIIKL